MVGYIGQQRDLAMTMCTSALAHARSAWRRRGMSRDPSHEQGIAGAVDVKAGVKDELPNHYKGFLDRYVKYADELPPCSGPESERDDSPAAMFRRMDGAAVGSGAAAGAGADGDPCSSSLARSHRPPAALNNRRTVPTAPWLLSAASTGEPCSLSTTRRVAVTVVPHRTAPALPETTGGCPKDMRIKIAQFPWPRSFSGRLLGGAVQLGRYSDLAGR